MKKKAKTAKNSHFNKKKHKNCKIIEKKLARIETFY